MATISLKQIRHQRELLTRKPEKTYRSFRIKSVVCFLSSAGRFEQHLCGLIGAQKTHKRFYTEIAVCFCCVLREQFKTYIRFKQFVFQTNFLLTFVQFSVILSSKTKGKRVGFASGCPANIQISLYGICVMFFVVSRWKVHFSTGAYPGATFSLTYVTTTDSFSRKPRGNTA